MQNLEDKYSQLTDLEFKRILNKNSKGTFEKNDSKVKKVVSEKTFNEFKWWFIYFSKNSKVTFYVGFFNESNNSGVFINSEGKKRFKSDAHLEKVGEIYQVCYSLTRLEHQKFNQIGSFLDNISLTNSDWGKDRHAADFFKDNQHKTHIIETDYSLVDKDKPYKIIKKTYKVNVGDLKEVKKGMYLSYSRKQLFLVPKKFKRDKYNPTKLIFSKQNNENPVIDLKLELNSILNKKILFLTSDSLSSHIARFLSYKTFKNDIYMIEDLVHITPEDIKTSIVEKIPEIKNIKQFISRTEEIEKVLPNVTILKKHVIMEKFDIIIQSDDSFLENSKIISENWDNNTWKFIISPLNKWHFYCYVADGKFDLEKMNKKIESSDIIDDFIHEAVFVGDFISASNKAKKFIKELDKIIGEKNTDERVFKF